MAENSGFSNEREIVVHFCHLPRVMVVVTSKGFAFAGQGGGAWDV